MKASLIVLAIFAAAVSALNTTDKWDEFKTRHGKSYTQAEELRRRIIFSKNYEIISKHNALYDQGLVSYKLDFNAFTDLTEEEYKQSRLGFKSSESYSDDVDIVTFQVPADTDIPDEIDWRNNGAVTGIKDQSVCGSCWAFSAVGALEGQHFLKTGQLVSISEKNLVDCSKELGNAGCQGGDMVGAFLYVHNNDGIDSEDSYPYFFLQTACKYEDASNITSATKEVIRIEVGNEEELKAAVATYGPVAIAIDADHISFQLYSKGVYYEKRCESGESDPLNILNHGVLLVGYGSENGEDYWLVKNSWGVYWGEDGYIKMARNRENNCGVASYAVLPVMY